jgi:3-oxoacyl-[acyl-carrier protein] reductase
VTATRTALVVGGASGLGWATCQAMAADGYRVTVADRDEQGAARRADELGDPHSAHVVEVTDEGSVAALFDAVGQLDAVVNCAGVSGFGLITELPVDQFRMTVDVCLTGSFLIAQHAGRRLAEGGCLVLIASLNARQPAVGMSAYCAAKAGVAMLSQVAALELGPRGIRVNAVSPGLVPTPLTDPGLAIPGVLDGYLENTALGRAGTPEDIAEAVLFICSPRASWLTGEVLDINGGAHLKRYPDLHAIMRKAFE